MSNTMGFDTSPQATIRLAPRRARRRTAQRRPARVPVDAQIEFSRRGGREFVPGIAKELSVCGVFIATSRLAAVGTELVVCLRLAGTSKYVVMPGIVRWVVAGGMGIQFGLLGARATHAITTRTRTSVARRQPPRPADAKAA